MIRRMGQLAAFTAGWALALFSSAGTFRWPRAWIYIALSLLGMAATAPILRRRNPGLIEARGKWHKDTKPFDKVFLAIYLPLVFALAVVAGLDAVRFRWAPLPLSTLYPGAALYAIATAWISWAMVMNPYLEQTVRIQHDRGHRVIDAGPYRFVRHPMYAGLIACYAAMPPILGSGWAFAVSAAVTAALLWRTVREDRTLREELPGYNEYASRTRYRLLPGVW